MKNDCRNLELSVFSVIIIHIEMSYKTLPLLFINLGGEMMYILDQRLKAQDIPHDKARKGEQA